MKKLLLLLPVSILFSNLSYGSYNRLIDYLNTPFDCDESFYDEFYGDSLPSLPNFSEIEPVYEETFFSHDTNFDQEEDIEYSIMNSQNFPGQVDQNGTMLDYIYADQEGVLDYALGPDMSYESAPGYHNNDQCSQSNITNSFNELVEETTGLQQFGDGNVFPFFQVPAPYQIPVQNNQYEGYSQFYPVNPCISTYVAYDYLSGNKRWQSINQAGLDYWLPSSKRIRTPEPAYLRHPCLPKSFLTFLQDYEGEKFKKGDNVKIGGKLHTLLVQDASILNGITNNKEDSKAKDLLKSFLDLLQKEEGLFKWPSTEIAKIIESRYSDKTTVDYIKRFKILLEEPLDKNFIILLNHPCLPEDLKEFLQENKEDKSFKEGDVVQIGTRTITLINAHTVVLNSIIDGTNKGTTRALFQAFLDELHKDKSIFWLQDKKIAKKLHLEHKDLTVKNYINSFKKLLGKPLDENFISTLNHPCLPGAMRTFLQNNEGKQFKKGDEVQIGGSLICLSAHEKTVLTGLTTGCSEWKVRKLFWRLLDLLKENQEILNWQPAEVVDIIKTEYSDSVVPEYISILKKFMIAAKPG